MLEALFRFGCNSTVIVPIKHAGPETRKAPASYPQTSRLNHSCYPNIVGYYEGAKLLINSIVPLQQGEVLRYCYGPLVLSTQHSSMSRAAL